ncbi:MFS transporter, partial [Sphaerisporangium aureirubrum]
MHTSAAEPAELGRQRWFRLLPVAFVTYSLAYLDRSNFAIGVAGGMEQDLQLSGAVSSLIGASFFLGYCLFQIPGTLYAERRSVRELIFWCTLAWGLLAAAQGLLHSAWLLVLVRFLLGAVEAAVLPAMVVFLARWFTKRERGSANAVLILGNP